MAMRNVGRYILSYQIASFNTTRCRLSFGSSKVPSTPSRMPEAPSEPKDADINEDLVSHLERLALVDFDNYAAVDRLKKAVAIAEILQEVDTSGVEPLDTLHENGSLHLREDDVTEGNCRRAIMRNAAETVEHYFVAPPGNIALEKTEKDFLADNSEKT